MLNPDRHIDVHPVLELAGTIEDPVKTALKFYDVFINFVGELALLSNIKLFGLHLIRFSEHHIDLRTNLIRDVFDGFARTLTLCNLRGQEINK